MAVTLQRCVDAMAQAAGRPLTDDEIERVAVRLQERVERLRRNRGSASDADLLREASGQLRREANEEAAHVRRSALYQARSYAAIRGVVDQFDNPAEALKAILGGLNTPGAPSRFSIDYRGKGIADEYVGGLTAALRQAAPDDRLLTAFMRGTHDAAIADEMWAMPAGAVGPGHGAVTGNEDALAIARILHNTQEAARLRANRAGAWIGALPGYIVRQSHDPLRLRRQGFEAWRRAIEPLLDDATFERAQSRVDQVTAERATAEAERDQAAIDVRGGTQILTPFAARMRQVLEANRTAAAQQGALREPAILTANVPASETMRANVIAEASQAAGRARRALRDREADALGKFADRVERMAAAEDEVAFSRLQSQVASDYARIVRRLDATQREALGLGRGLGDAVEAINNAIDRRRRAEARLQAADLALGDLEFRGRADDRGAFLQAVYNDIVSGRTILPEGSGSYVAGIGGSSNVASKVSRERVLEFRDAASWRTYHEQFGVSGNLATAAVHGLQRLGRQTALIETLGPNPVANFTRLRRHLQDASQGNADLATALRSSSIDHLLEWVTGEARAIENPTGAAIGATVRGFNNITKLGFMLFSSVADTVSLAAEAKFQGKGYLHGYATALEDLFAGRGNDERRLISDLSGAGLEGMTGAIGSRFDAIDGVPGFMSWAMKKMYALNVGAWWTDAHKIGATRMQTRGWAIDSARAFGELGPEQQRLFGLYGIGSTEWDLLRATAPRLENGRAHLLPADMRRLPTDEVARIADRPLTDYQAVRILDDAGDRFSTLLADRADYAVPTPGGREMAAMYGGHKPGSAWGEAARLFWQFKQFPVSVLTKPIANMAANAESRVAAATSIGALFLQMTAMGYVGMSLKDVFKNKEPRSPADWQTWIAAAAQGGGLGIYGDFLFGDFDRFGRSAAENAMGPTLGGLAPDVVKLWAQSIRGELRASDAVRFTANQIPFANLFYVKPVLDAVLASEVYERLNPGYRRRAEAEMQRREGRGFLFHP